MEERSTISIFKSLETEKGEVVTMKVELVNTSPKKKIVQDLLSNLLSEIISLF